MSANEITQIQESIGHGTSWDGIVKKHGLRIVGGGADVIVREQIETRRMGKYAYLVFSFSQSFLDYLGATNEIDFYLNANGLVGLKNGDSVSLYKIGKRMSFKIRKNKIVNADANELTLYVELDDGTIKSRKLIIKKSKKNEGKGGHHE